MAVQSRSIDSHRLQSTVLCNTIPAALVYGVYISQLIGYSRTSGSDDDFVIECYCMTWLIVTKYLYHKGPGYIPFVVITMRSFPQSWFFNGVVTRLTRRAIHAEQELLTLPEHLSPPPVLVVFVLLDLLFSTYRLVDDCFTFACHCFVCPFSIYYSRLPLWYLQIFTL